jgi:hypothetical protein
MWLGPFLIIIAGTICLLMVKAFENL